MLNSTIGRTASDLLGKAPRPRISALVGSCRNSSLRARRQPRGAEHQIRATRMEVVPPLDTQHQSTRGEDLAQISTGLVQLHSRYYGKGPTKAKTHMVNDTVISILRGGFTTVERTMIDQGRLAAVHEMRRSFQDVMEEQFTAVVQEATGRTVIAYMSQVHTNPDLAVEIFVLEPTAEEPPSQVDLEDLPEVG